MHYWLLKSEPRAYSIDDLKREHVGMWDGVRNYQARNLIRDTMKKGDMVLFYHSNTQPIGIYGIAKVVKEGYPDPTQFNPKKHHFDPKAQKSNPRWYVVDIQFVKKFSEPLTLSIMKNDPAFNDMLVTQRGVRLSVQPVSEKHFKHVLSITDND